MKLPEVEPPAAMALFGDHVAGARAFAEQLFLHGERRGLIGPLEAERLWSRHILNSAAIAAAFATGARVADVGSGAGLPGIALAIARPDVSWTLIEPMERRVVWLREQTELLNLSNVDIVRARVEDLAGAASFDAVTARAVSALRTLVPLVAPVARPGGELVLLKGASVANEITAAAKQLRRFDLRDARVQLWGEGVLEEPVRVFRATVGCATS